MPTNEAFYTSIKKRLWMTFLWYGAHWGVRLSQEKTLIGVDLQNLLAQHLRRFLY